MLVRGLAIVMILAGCIADPTVPCGDTRCPAGDTCTPAGCAARDAVAACANGSGRSACTTRDITNGVCHDGACWPVVCGDGFVDPGEVCDDGNTTAGDGCSAACDSDETCGNGVVDATLGEQCDSGIPGLSHDGCSSRCTIELVDIVDVSPTDITPRGDAAFGYLPKQNQLVVFGGNLGSSLANDTWVFTFGQWVDRVVSNPPPARYKTAMAFDPINETLLMFGGAGAVGPLDDTWAWDGTAWKQLHPAFSPPARWGAAVALDTKTNHIVIYGGVGVTDLFDDTWEWDGANWKQVGAAGGPGKIVGAAMAYDAQHDQLVLYGGTSFSGQIAATTWLGRDGVWTSSGAAGPGQRTNASMTYDGAHVLLYGGAVDSRLWLWDGGQWTAQSLTSPPPPRFSAGFVVAGTLDILFGGIDANNHPLGDTWVLQNAVTWTELPPAKLAPPPRYNAAGAYIATAGAAVVFGGRNSSGVYNDTWMWKPGQWTEVGVTGPSARFAHCMVAEPSRKSLLLFGGLDGSAQLAPGTYRFGPDQAWHTLTPATPLPLVYGAAADYDPERDRIVVFGGINSSGATGETWEWDGANWSRVATTGPDARAGAVMAFDPTLHAMVLFGGGSSVAIYNDTWSWDGHTWQQLHPATSPQARTFATLTLDPVRHRLVLLGGQAAGLTLFGEAWEWDGTTWTLMQPVGGAPLVASHASFYDPISLGVVSFGGVDPSQFARDRTIDYAYLAPSMPFELCLSATSDDDGDQLAGCADPDCWGRCTPLCPPGTSCPAGSPSCGDGMCEAVEDNAICPLDCP